MSKKHPSEIEEEEAINEPKQSEKSSAKTHTDILREQISAGDASFKRSNSSILISSFTAGLEIGFSFLMICSLFYFLSDKVEPDTAFKLISLVYPLGFVLVILGRSSLFTEQSSLLSLPVFSGKQKVHRLLKLWGLIIVGNLFGGYLIALTLSWIGPKLGIFDSATIEEVSLHILGNELTTIFVSAILAGWLMGLLSWLLTSTKDTISKIVIIFLITGIMSFSKLHHSIIGSIEVFSGMLNSSQITIGDYAEFEGLALLGNAIGGVVFVALLKYRAFSFNFSGKTY